MGMPCGGEIVITPTAKLLRVNLPKKEINITITVRKLGGPEISLFITQPSWAYCEMPGDVEARIRRFWR